MNNLKSDFPASIVVFFVALPLCLGIALASGAPLISGLIAGIVGGIIVGSLSGSQIGVSGPAAGLAAIVLTAITSLGGFETFLVAVILAGIFQIILGVMKAGVIGYFFPASVIKGMLSAIGIIIILKQIPHFFGYDADWEGDLSFIEADGSNTFSRLLMTVKQISTGSTIISVISLALLILWDKVLIHKGPIFRIIQGPIVAVALGIIYSISFAGDATLGISPEHLVAVPIFDLGAGITSQLTFPNFAAIQNTEVWIVAITICVVASLETLLCVEATDKLDPHKRVTPTNRELFAQGVGNVISGAIGGLPSTQVIVRSSANIQSRNKTKASAIIHGFLLLIAVFILPNVINLIPLSVLAAILLMVGYKLAKPVLFKSMYRLGKKQFVPFIVTIVGIVFTDLLVGIIMGLATSLVIILLESFNNSHFMHLKKEESLSSIVLAEEVTFFNKAAILKSLQEIPNGNKLEIDFRGTVFIDYDVIEILHEFQEKASERDISITFIFENEKVESPTNLIERLLNKRKVQA